MTAQPSCQIHPSRPNHRPPRARYVAMTVVTLAMAVLSPSAAHAKGPGPLPPVPQGPLVVGRATPVEVRLEWAEGTAPSGSDGRWLTESLEMWPENWSVLAVSKEPEAPGSLDNAETLAVTPLGEGLFMTTFTPPRSGDWRLVVAATHYGTGERSVIVERRIHVADASSPSSAVDSDEANSLWLPVEFLSVLGVIALLAVVLRFRARARRGAKLDSATAQSTGGSDDRSGSEESTGAAGPSPA